MDIKKMIRYGFVVIILFVSVMVFIETVAIHQIERNNQYLKIILELVSLQDDMNFLSNDLFLTKSERELKKLKNKFLNSEEEFEKVKSKLIGKKRDSILDGFINDVLQVNEVERDLDVLFKHELIIEKMFNTIYQLQSNKIKLQDNFDKLYPNEKKFRENLTENIFFNVETTKMHKFLNVGYYSKEALFQKKDQKSLDKWLDSIKKLKEISDDNDSIDRYYSFAKKIGSKAINIENIKNRQKNLSKNIIKVIKDNRKLNNEIRNDIENISSKFINKIYLYLLILSLIIISIIIVITYKVNKNVGLSVDEIQKKIDDGLKEIKALNKEIEDTQREIVFKMGAIGERRSKETGNHVRRVAEYSEILGLYYGLPKEECMILKEASPMHDIGKVAIPDYILNKPGRLTEDEMKVMRTHAELGYEMLSGSKRAILKTAAIVAYEHHEKWDGSGYPRGLKGEEIHIYGRITAVADVFDALGSDRVYKKAWEDEKIFAFFKEQKGRHFDPKLVDIFFEHLDEFLEIRDKYRDKFLKD